jgi:hypothetical protein
MQSYPDPLSAALDHVRQLADELRHTTEDDRWFKIAEAQGWVRRLPGIMDDRRQFRVAMTVKGELALVPNCGNWHVSRGKARKQDLSRDVPKSCTR